MLPGKPCFGCSPNASGVFCHLSVILLGSQSYRLGFQCFVSCGFLVQLSNFFIDGYGTLKTLDARWLGGLKGIVTDFEVGHHRGHLHGNADGLSHLPWDKGSLVKVS